MQSANNWTTLSKIVYRRTYSRNDTGVQENWDQTVERYVAGNVRGHNVPESEIKSLIRLGKERKAIPAGRGLWFSGSPAHERIGGSALCNCWFLDARDWTNFVVAQDLLMLGGGVGLSVEHKFTSKLPRVKPDVVITHKATKDADYIIPDSREGWCELTYRILDSYFRTGKSFSYSTVCIRGYGEPIKGFGGVASGPIPLVSFVRNIGLILGPRANRHVRPVDAADILTACGEMVVAGNVRRSAIIILGDAWDKEYLTSKRWDLGPIPSYRSCANYSVICDDIDDLHPSFWKTYEHGEPFGLVNRKNIQKYGRMGEEKKDTAWGTNPCQPAWAPVLTSTGIKTLKSVEAGDTIWSGSTWTKVIKKWSTGVKPVWAFYTTAGVFYGTDNHRVISNGERIEAGLAESLDTCQGSIGSNLGTIIPDVVDGLVLGDGTYHKASKKLFLCVGRKDHDYFTSEVADYIGDKSGAGPSYYNVDTRLTKEQVPLTYKRVIPDDVFYGSPLRVTSFLRGLYSANGSVITNRVTLKAASLQLIVQVQQMLSSIGIRSYYTSNKPSEVRFNNGTYTCKRSYDLNISTDRDKFANTIGFLQKYKVEALKEAIANTKKSPKDPKQSYQVYRRELIGVEEVFDMTVDCPEHTYWTGGHLVSNCAEATLESHEQCNLQEIALMNLKSEDEFIEAARLMHRYGKRVTMERYGSTNIEEVVYRNRRIGTGITGCLGSPLFNGKTLDRVYGAIQDENILYSRQLEIPTSIRTTVVKPSGTVSKLLDQGGYEGIHPAFSRYVIQRIRFSANDPLIPVLKAAGHRVEPVLKLDGTSDPGTLVVEFYLEAPAGLPVADEDWTTWKQLEVLQMAQTHWADQAVSVTVYYKKSDLPAIKEWLSNNLKYLKTISFLCHNDHGFQQAPKEAITKEQFEKFTSKLKPVDIDQIGEGDLESQECVGGVCPVK